MENCDVCCEKFNRTNHKRVECPFCDLVTCRTCCQRYIIDSFEDPHCMGCKTHWNREFVDMFCTKYFRNTVLRRHRENVLFEREKALMPQTQPEVERILKIRKLKRILREQKCRLFELHHEYRTFDNDLGTVVNIPPEIRTLYRDMENVYRELQHLKSMTHTSHLDETRFVRKCPNEICKGFLNEQWFCGLCDTYYCRDCNEENTSQHICDPKAVETMNLINKDSKPCPKCGTVICKSSGCAQMWCTSCHTAFNWRTGEIETGRIHNPHFIEFKKKTMISREHGDIPCGGSPSFRELREIGATNEILQYSMAFHQVEWENVNIDLEPIDNLHVRVSYMLNDITEKEFKIFLQRQEKFKEKMRDISHIFEMMSNTGGDLLRQYVIEPHRHDEIINLLQKVVDYGNDVIDVIRKRYNSKIPRNISV